jgi:hypothetical protein
MFTKSMFEGVMNRHNPAVRSAVERATAAGIPWTTILEWLALQGPAIARGIKVLIDQWRNNNNPPATTPPDATPTTGQGGNGTPSDQGTLPASAKAANGVSSQGS